MDTVRSVVEVIGKKYKLGDLHADAFKIYTEITNALKAAKLYDAPDEVRIVFDGPPGPVSGRFIETETPDGASIKVGEWHKREGGWWELRMRVVVEGID